MIPYGLPAKPFEIYTYGVVMKNFGNIFLSFSIFTLFFFSLILTARAATPPPVTDWDGPPTISYTGSFSVTFAFNDDNITPSNEPDTVHLERRLSGGDWTEVRQWSSYNEVHSYAETNLSSGTYQYRAFGCRPASDGGCGFGSQSISREAVVEILGSDLPLNQDFESGLGPWTNSNSYWRSRSGSTPSSNTGPSGATSGSQYYYFETSSGSAYTAGNAGEVASPDFELSDSEVVFSYHMYGVNTGTLYVDAYSGGQWHTVWSRTGQQHTSSSHAWSQAVVPFSGYSGTGKVRFRAVAAGGYRGDIAIDAIVIRESNGVQSGELADIPDADYTPASAPSQDLVGELKGNPQVSGGAFSYSIPLSVPPGINGMQPSVSLNYSSQSGLSNAGYGWSMSAGSSISRCPNIFPLDNKNQSVVRNNADRLCLDGQILVLKSGTHGQTGAVYQPERSKDVTVFLKGAGVNGPLNGTAGYFEVRTKTGRLRTYGQPFVPVNTSYSSLNNVPLSWQLTQEEDTFGNNIQYSYETGSGYILLSDIYYTGRNGSQGNRQIEFVYEDSSDVSTIEYRERHSYNYKTVDSHRLSRVNIRIAGNQTDYYELIHNSDHTIDAVRHCFGSDCLESEFTYKQNTGAVFAETSNHIKAGVTDGDNRYLLMVPYQKVGDFDGDGIEELSYYQVENDLSVLYYYFSGTGDAIPASDLSNITDAQGLEVDYDCDTALDTSCIVEYSVFSNAFKGDMDFDYDGRKDIVYVNNSGNVAIANWHDTSSIDTGIDADCAIPGYAFNQGLVSCTSFVLDINGDGRQDLLVASGDYQTEGVVTRAYLRDASGDGFSYAGIYSGGLNGYQLADINGDGHTDLVNPSLQRWVKVSASTNIATFIAADLPFESAINRGTAVRSSHTQMLDLNGDGLSDFLTLSLKPSPQNNWDLGWYAVINEGNGQFADPVYTGRAEERSSVDASESLMGSNNLSGYIKPFDYNGDGRTDLLLPHQSAIAYQCVPYPFISSTNCYDENETYQHWRSDVWRWKVWQAQPDGTGFDEILLDSSILGTLSTTNLIDYNGDGELDIATNIGYDRWKTWAYPSFHADKIGTHVYLRNANEYQHKLLASVSTDFGEQFRVTYANLNSDSVDGDPIYSVNHSSQQFPYVNFGSSMVVVDQIETRNGIGGMNASRYKYADARYHYQGRGFQGFREITVEQVAHDLTQTTEYYQDFPLTGQMFAQRTEQSSTGILISESNAVVGSEETDDVQCAYVSERISKTYDLADSTTPISETRTTTEMDDNCNQVSKTVVTNDKRSVGSSANWITHTTTSTAENEAVSGMQGAFRQASASVTSSVSYSADDRNVTLPDANTIQIVSTSYSYAAASDVLPQSVTVSGGDTLTTTMSYDSFGHAKRITYSGTGISANTRWTETAYTSDGYFVASTHNSEWGLSVDASSLSDYNLRYGLPQTSTDANGVVTEQSYNALGAVTSARTYKNGINAAPPVYTQYQWCDSGCPSGLLFRVTTTQVGSPEATVYFDSAARDVRSEMETFNGQANLVSTKTYDTLGRLTSESNSVGASTTYSGFDVLGRPGSKTTDVAPQSYTANYDYAGFTTEVTVVGAKTLEMSRTINSRGQLMRTKDADGNFTYNAYDGAGNLTLVRDVNNNDIVAVYNAMGFKTHVDDPNQGASYFSYNGLGELLSVIDAKLQVTVFALDDLGRVTQKNQNNDVSYWDYDLEQYGLLDSDSRAGHSRSYDYDAFGRVVAQTTRIDGVDYEHAWAFDTNYGRIKGQQAPNGHVVAFTYDDLGFAQEDYQPDINGNMLKSYARYTDYTRTGALKTLRLGNGLYQTINHHLASGQIDTLCTGTSAACNGAWSAQYLDYGYDSFGNLINMTDHVGDIHREYYYDDLHRLDYVDTMLGGNGAERVNYAYDAAGNLTLKDDYASTYRYGNSNRNAGGNAGPNAVRQVVKNGSTVNFTYDNAGNMISGDGLSITYDANHHTKTVSRNGTNLTFYYDADGQRYKQVKTKSGVTTTTVYVGDFEKVTESGSNSKVFTRHYVGSHTILTDVISGSSDAPSISHITRDRLGSVSLILDGDRHIDGNTAHSLVLERRDYDPFGKAIILPTGVLPSLFKTTDRGFTDHEHLLDVELIHMNGRAFDYKLGRFLSVDPFIAGNGSQAINPYSYIGNNPLSGVDPSGYSASCSGDVDTCSPPDVDQAPQDVAFEEGDAMQVFKNGDVHLVKANGDTYKVDSVTVKGSGFSDKYNHVYTGGPSGGGLGFDSVGKSEFGGQGSAADDFASVGIKTMPDVSESDVFTEEMTVTGQVAAGPAILGVPLWQWGVAVFGGATLASQTEEGKEATNAMINNARNAMSGGATGSPGGWDNDPNGESDPSNSPIYIPEGAKRVVQQKNGYTQVKYTWRADGYKFEARWHTRTPGAPAGSAPSWVVMRTTPGHGGVRPVSHILTRVNSSTNRWVTRREWQQAISARQAGTATRSQSSLLDSGHFR